MLSSIGMDAATAALVFDVETLLALADGCAPRARARRPCCCLTLRVCRSVERAIDMFLNFGDAISSIAPPRAAAARGGASLRSGGASAAPVEAMPPAPAPAGGIVLSCGVWGAL